MSVDKLVDSTQLDADLTSVANAIRTKGGTSAQLAFPADFVTAINAISGGGGNSYTLTTYTLVSEMTIGAVINAASIPLISQNEVLIWNVKGTTKQNAGSVGGKMGITVVQNGVAVSNSGMYKRSASVTAPDSMRPSSTSTNWTLGVVDGKYHETSIMFFVGSGNTVDFIQIPYNIGWATS